MKTEIVLRTPNINTLNLILYTLNLSSALSKEHTKAQTTKIVQYIGDNKERFAELMNILFTGDSRISQRAAWPLSICVQQHPELIKPYFKKLIQKMQQPGIHNGIIRNSLRLLQDVIIPKTWHGTLMNYCFALIQKHGEPVANKAFAITILDNLSKEYPDIRQELVLVIRERWDHESAAFKSRGRKVFRDKY